MNHRIPIIRYASLPDELMHLPVGKVVLYGTSKSMHRSSLYIRKVHNVMDDSFLLSHFSRLEMEVVACATEDELLQGRMFVRQINIGSIGKTHLLSAFYNEEDSMEQLWEYFMDIQNLESVPLKLFNSNRPKKNLLSSLEQGILLSKPNSSRSSSALPHCIMEEDMAMSEACQSIENLSPEEQQLCLLEEEKQKFVDKISALILDYVTRTKQMPPMDEINTLVKGKFILQNSQLSRLVVNRNLKIILPDYNELEIRLYPLPKAIYFLFLLHPEGIVLKHISDYREELEELYGLIMPNKDEALMQNSLSSLLNPVNGSLMQKIANIKRAFKALILNEELASQYYIKGRRGGVYRIHLPAASITLPNVFSLK